MTGRHIDGLISMPWIVTPSLLVRRSEFYYQISALLNAGVPVIGALESVARSSRAFRPQILQSAEILKSGSTAVEAFRSIPDWLPPFDLALLEAGESAGRLPQCARMLSEYYDEQARLQRQALGFMIYPLAIAHVALLVFPVDALTAVARGGGLLAFLLPKIGVLALLYGGIFFILYALQDSRPAAWRNSLETILDAVPLVGSARQHRALARFCAALEALVSAGAGVVQSWTMAAAASGSFRLIRAVESMIPTVEAGLPPSEVLGRISAFPEMFVSSYCSGEVSGKIDETLRRLYVYFQESASRKMALISKAVPWGIYLLIMIAIAISVISFWMNYYGNMFNAV